MSDHLLRRVAPEASKRCCNCVGGFSDAVVISTSKRVVGLVKVKVRDHANFEGLGSHSGKGSEKSKI